MKSCQEITLKNPSTRWFHQTFDIGVEFLQ